MNQIAPIRNNQDVPQLKNNQPEYSGVCRGTAGELYQGVTSRGEIAIISALIPQYSRAFFLPDQAKHGQSREDDLQACGRSKTYKALELFCKKHSLARPVGKWRFESGLEVSRGMASSTADIVAMLRCLGAYFHRAISEDDITQILSNIERSDSVFIDEMVMFSSSHHKILKRFGALPPLYVAYFHESIKVDTEDSKEGLLAHYSRYQEEYLRLFNDAITAFSTKNMIEICKVSTRSTELSQPAIAKDSYSVMVENRDKFNADGVITAHTGSLIGYLFCNLPTPQIINQLSTFFSSLGGCIELTEVAA